jgi:DNA-binding NarL/FixJ family response regulator
MRSSGGRRRGRGPQGQRPPTGRRGHRHPHAPNGTDDGLRAAIAIRHAQPEVGVLVLSQYVDAQFAVELIGDDARGVGYLLKDRISDFEEFAVAVAVRQVAAGGSVLDPGT